jgi:AP-3 complex subunit mu
MSGAKTCSLNGNIKLSGSTVPDGAITVNASWKIPQTSISGLKIESVNITNEKYKAFKGVRAFTQSGKFQIRT